MHAEAALFSGTVFRNAGLRPYVAAMTSRLNRMRRELVNTPASPHVYLRKSQAL